MTCGEDKIVIHVKYKDVEKNFSGSVNNVWISINKFFSEFIPTFVIAKKMILNVNLQNLINDCEKLIALTNEGPHLLASRDKLTDSETLVLQLLASYIGFKLGTLESDAISREDLQGKLGKSSKIVSTRLGELVRRELAVKTNGGKYKISVFGIAQMQREILPRIKVKLSI